jgi:hypothetical protein
MLIYMYGWMHAWAVSSHQPCFSRPWFGHNWARVIAWQLYLLYLAVFARCIC